MTMDCMVQQPVWTGGYHHGGLASIHHHYFSPYYFPRKRTFSCSYFSGAYGLPSRLDDEVAFPTDIKLERPDECVSEDDKELKICVVCGERASGYYFGALVCLPCKSFYIRCTKDGEPNFTCQCNGNCDIAKQGRIRCQYCRYQRCLMAGMCRKEKPETVQPADGQVLCKVCGDIANGIHFGVNTCEGCKKFFRRGLVENQSYLCKSEKLCTINPRNRNNCRYCRYQKCISAGMSREAIKMGRPKKAETTDQNSTGNSDHTMNAETTHENASSKAITHHDKVPSPHRVDRFSPCSSPSRASLSDLNCNVNVFDLSKVKTEPVSCEMEQQNSMTTEVSQSDSSYLPMTSVYATSQSSDWPSSNFTQNREPMSSSHGNWTHPIAQSVVQPQTLSDNMMSAHSQSMMTSSAISMTTTAPTASDNLFAEDDMDDILAYLSQDQVMKNQEFHEQESQQQQQQSDFYSQNLSPPSQCMVENRNNSSSIKFPVPTHKQFEQQIQSYNNHMVQSDTYRQLSVNTSSPSIPSDSCAVSPNLYPSSPPTQQQHHQYTTPGHSQHYSSSPIQSPHYSSTSPVHYAPQSPDQYAASSPQHYQNPPYQPHSPSSCQFQNSPLDGSHYNPNSPVSPCSGSPCASPQYPAPSMTGGQYTGGNMCNQSGQFGQSPMSNNYQPNCSGYNQSQRKASFMPYLNIKAQMKINQMFMNCTNTEDDDSLDQDDSQVKGLSRDEFDSSVVIKSLSVQMPAYQSRHTEYNCSPGSSPLSYHDSSDESQDGFHCQHRNKRKNYDATTSFEDTPYNDSYQSIYLQQNKKDFLCEQYSMMRSKAYWNQPIAFNSQSAMSEEHAAFISHLLLEYQKFRDCCDESKISNNKMLEEVQWPQIGPGEKNHWNHVQRRVIRNTMAFVNFVRSIPGFDKIHHQDATTMCTIGSFQLGFIVAAADFFVPDQKRFLYFWNWTVSPNNPMYFFKLNLIQCGDNINRLKMSEIEKAFFMALSFLGTDLMSLVDAKAIESVRQRVIDALQAHLYAQGIDPVKRLQELMRVMPEVRHIVMWHKQLMKKMRVNMESQEVNQMFHDLNIESNQTSSPVGWNA